MEHHTVRKEMQTEIWTLSGGDSCWFYEEKYWVQEACDR